MADKIIELRAQAERVLVGVPDGAVLPNQEAALIRFGLASSVTALDDRTIDAAIKTATEEGATPAQLQEVASLVSGLGVHSLMVTANRLVRVAGMDVRPLTSAEQTLWDRHVGADPFWIGFERAIPGFLGAMLRLSADQFEAFFLYCAVPWKSGTVRARVKELVAMACDATPAHCFLPGFRLHLSNAISLGAGGAQIRQALDLAAAMDPR